MADRGHPDGHDWTPFTVTYSSTYLNLAAGGTNTPIQVGPATKSPRHQYNLQWWKRVVRSNRVCRAALPVGDADGGLLDRSPDQSTAPPSRSATLDAIP